MTPILLVDPSDYTPDGRYWWPGRPPHQNWRTTFWDFKRLRDGWVVNPHSPALVEPTIALEVITQVDPNSELGREIIKGPNYTKSGEPLIWFAFPKAHAEARWVPLDDVGQRIPQLPDVFSLWEARYAITQLDALWPERTRAAVNYTEWQPNRSKKI